MRPLTLADRVGITVPLAPHVPYTWRMLRTYGLDRFVSDIRPIGVYGADIAQRREEIFDITTKPSAAWWTETRAEIIVPLGGALIPYVVDPEESGGGDRRAGAQHQGDRHPLRGDVRGLRHDPERAHLSAREIELRGFREQVIRPVARMKRSAIRDRRSRITHTLHAGYRFDLIDL